MKDEGKKNALLLAAFEDPRDYDDALSAHEWLEIGLFSNIGQTCDKPSGQFSVNDLLCDAQICKSSPLTTGNIMHHDGSDRENFRYPLQERSPLPSTKILLRGQPLRLREFFKTRRGVLFGGPGAFTPTCSDIHITGFRDHADIIKSAGINFIGGIYANDPYVLKAWAAISKITDQFTFISDVEARLTSDLGVLPKKKIRGLGIRPRRFAMVIAEEGIVEWIRLDKECYALDVIRHLTLKGYLNNALITNISVVDTGHFQLPEILSDGLARISNQFDSDDPSDHEKQEEEEEEDPSTDEEDENPDIQPEERKDMVPFEPWRALLLDASVRGDDLTKLPLMTLHLGRGEIGDETVSLQYYGTPTQHTVSHTPRCLRISIDMSHEIDGFGYARFDGHNYVATEFHIVSPSPHLLDHTTSFRRPFELRIVHQCQQRTTRSEFLVVAVTFRPPPFTASERDNLLAHNSFLAQLLEIPTLTPDVFEVFQVGRRALPEGAFKLFTLFEEKAEFHKYRGVLSAMNEKVTWLILKEAQCMSITQVHQFERFLLRSGNTCGTAAEVFAMVHVYRMLPKFHNIRASNREIIIETLRKKIYAMTKLEQLLCNSVLQNLGNVGSTAQWLFAFRQKINEQQKEMQDLCGLTDRALEAYPCSISDIEQMKSEITCRMGEKCCSLTQFLSLDNVQRLIRGIRKLDPETIARNRTTDSLDFGPDVLAMRSGFSRSITVPPDFLDKSSRWHALEEECNSRHMNSDSEAVSSQSEKHRHVNKISRHTTPQLKSSSSKIDALLTNSLDVDKSYGSSAISRGNKSQRRPITFGTESTSEHAFGSANSEDLKLRTPQRRNAAVVTTNQSPEDSKRSSLSGTLSTSDNHKSSVLRAPEANSDLTQESRLSASSLRDTAEISGRSHDANRNYRESNICELKRSPMGESVVAHLKVPSSPFSSPVVDDDKRKAKMGDDDTAIKRKSGTSCSSSPESSKSGGSKNLVATKPSNSGFRSALDPRPLCFDQPSTIPPGILINKVENINHVKSALKPKSRNIKRVIRAKPLNKRLSDSSYSEDSLKPIRERRSITSEILTDDSGGSCYGGSSENCGGTSSNSQSSDGAVVDESGSVVSGVYTTEESEESLFMDRPKMAKGLTPERVELVKFMISQLKKSSGAERLSTDALTTANTAANASVAKMSESQIRKQQQRKSLSFRRSSRKTGGIRFKEVSAEESVR